MFWLSDLIMNFNDSDSKKIISNLNKMKFLNICLIQDKLGISFQNFRGSLGSSELKLYGI